MRYKKLAYSLAEVMVVMLILTIIFAAFAPIVTRRRIANNASAYNPWNFTDTTSTMNAYVNPTNASLKNAVYFGLTPATKDAATDDINSETDGLNSKVIIKANDIGNKVQSHIQLRYGRDPVYSNDSINDYGIFAANLLVDTNENILFTTRKLVDKWPDLSQSIIYGAKTLDNNNQISGQQNIIVGYNALKQANSSTNALAIGAYTKYANTNSTYTYSFNNNSYIGAYAGALPDSGSASYGIQNIFLGYNTGKKGNESSNNIYMGSSAGHNTTGNSNIAVGYEALSSNTEGKYNVAIGAGALKRNTTGHNNVALGYNACSQVTEGSNKICIGAESGPRPGMNGIDINIAGTIKNMPKYSNNTSSGPLNAAIANQSIKGEFYSSGRTDIEFKDATTDDYNRIYIGGRPGKYNGDAVMEIHNIGLGGSGTSGDTKGFTLINFPNKNLTGSTTVINGNLVVTGRIFLTIGDYLYPFSHSSITTKDADNNSIVRQFLVTYGKKACDPNLKGSGDTLCPTVGKGNSYSDGWFSDRRLKNILGLNNAGLNEIDLLNIYNYTFKDDKSKTPQVGVIAQELQKVFPNAVSQGEDGYLRIRWHEMFYASINAIKQIDKKVASLTKKLINIEGQITKLEKENEILKTQVDSLAMRVNNIKK